MNRTQKGANGSGSIFRVQRGGRTVWKVQVTIGRAPDGRILRTTRTAKGKPEADRILRTLLQQRDVGLLVQVSSETVATYALRWVREVVTLRVRNSTSSGYEDILRRYVFPCIGNVRMADLRAQHVQKLIGVLAADGKSANTINQTRRVLHAVCAFAVRQQVIGNNPVALTDAVRRKAGDPTQVKHPWTIEESGRALNLARSSDRVDCFLHLMLYTGMRPGEALGMRWEDIDFDRGLLHVTGTLREERRLMPDGTGVVRLTRNEPKTLQSRRALTMQPELRAALIRQQMRQSIWQTSNQGEWRFSGYVVSTQVGTPVNPSNMRKWFYRFLKNSSLRQIRMHDLRHVVAKCALEADARLEDVSQALGHTRLDTTKQIYAGNVQRLNDRFAQSIGDLFSVASQECSLVELQEDRSEVDG